LGKAATLNTLLEGVKLTSGRLKTKPAKESLLVLFDTKSLPVAPPPTIASIVLSLTTVTDLASESPNLTTGFVCKKLLPVIVIVSPG